MAKTESRLRRVDIRAILADKVTRRELFISTIQAAQAREGILTTYAQAACAYDKVRAEIEAVG